MPWVPSSSLMTTGAPPTRSIASRTSARLRTNAVARHPDVVARQDLRRPQLVARVRDAVRGVRRVDVHLLELPHDGGAEVGDRVADARQDRVVVGQQLAAVLQVGLVAGQVDREAQRVEHLAPRGRGRSAAARSRCVEYACGARERMASFMGVPLRRWGSEPRPPSKHHSSGWREWVSLPGIGVSVDQGEARHRRAQLVAPRLRHRGARATATGCASRCTPGRSPTTTRSTVECAGARPPRGAQLVRAHRGAHRRAARRRARSAARCTAEMTLSNRDQMGFRMLVGREALRQGFVVDPARSFLGGRAPREIRRRNRGRELG